MRKDVFPSGASDLSQFSLRYGLAHVSCSVYAMPPEALLSVLYMYTVGLWTTTQCNTKALHQTSAYTTECWIQ